MPSLRNHPNPYFIYGSIVWASNYDAIIKGLTLIQKRKIRIKLPGTKFTTTTMRDLSN